MELHSPLVTAVNDAAGVPEGAAAQALPPPELHFQPTMVQESQAADAARARGKGKGKDLGGLLRGPEPEASGPEAPSQSPSVMLLKCPPSWCCSDDSFPPGQRSVDSMQAISHH